MTNTRRFQAIKGVRDILPPESTAWNRVEQTAREVFESYNFREIRLPIFEQTELFARSVGADTDIVSKEMYEFVATEFGTLELQDLYDFARFRDQVTRGLQEGTIPQTKSNRKLVDDFVNAFDEVVQSSEALPRGGFQDTGGVLSRQLTNHNNKLFRAADLARRIQLGARVVLRPEATASVCRAYIEHGMHTWPQPVKLYYVGPMFRRERPQKGRYRQFYQIGAEVLGQSEHPAIDAEVVEMLMVFLGRLQLEGAKLYINSIGCKNCRPKYVNLLRSELEKVKERLGADSRRRIESNPLRVLDSKLDSEQAIVEKLPRISDHLCEACRKHFAAFQEQLKLRGIAYEVNWRLVRGLDYYMRTTFEITAPSLGAQNAICGGGRYDGLVELLGGPPTKGIGFAIGTDRLILSLHGAGKLESSAGVDVFIAWMGQKSFAIAVRLARRLREAGLTIELPPEEAKFKKSLGLADKLGARYALIIGEEEVSAGQFTLKRLADGRQEKLMEEGLMASLTAMGREKRR